MSVWINVIAVFAIEKNIFVEVFSLTDLIHKQNMDSELISYVTNGVK